MIQELESTIGDSTTIYIAHILNTGLAGMLRLDPKDGYILSAFVQEAHRGAGIGSALIERACALCRERSHEVIGLSVADDNPRARELYRRLGFIKYASGHEGYTQFIKVL